jgi:hypothetical protein
MMSKRRYSSNVELSGLTKITKLTTSFFTPAARLFRCQTTQEQRIPMLTAPTGRFLRRLGQLD